MAITDNSDMVMPVAPINNGGFGGNGFGGDWAWIILLLLAFSGGWGNGFGGGYAGGNELYPWMNQSEVTTNGFQNLSTQNQITAVQSDLGDIQTQLCNGFAGVNATVNSGFANAETAANARQIANMQTAFNAQAAMSQGFNDVTSQLASCCCENRLGTADLKYTIATENCADRQALNEGVRDIIASQTAGTQRILDKLSDQELQAERRENQNLRSELMYARGQASQIEQTAQILANNNAQTALFQQGMNNEVDALYNRLSNCPVPTVPVYGRQPIFTCNQNNGCGCGCGA